MGSRKLTHGELTLDKSEVSVSSSEVSVRSGLTHPYLLSDLRFFSSELGVAEVTN